MGVVDGFPNNQAISILEALYKSGVGTFVSLRDVRNRIHREDVQYQITEIKRDHPNLIEYKELDVLEYKKHNGHWPYPLDKDMYSITSKGIAFIKAFRKVKKILES